MFNGKVFTLLIGAAAGMVIHRHLVKPHTPGAGKAPVDKFIDDAEVRVKKVFNDLPDDLPEQVKKVATDAATVGAAKVKEATKKATDKVAAKTSKSSSSSTSSTSS